MFKLLKISSLIVLLFAGNTAKSQVLISLIFGEKLNTPKIEFGLDGGWNRSYIMDIAEAKPLDNFNIGFYFHLMLGESEKHFLSTGVLVKSNVGASGMPTYPIGDAEFDSLYADGDLTKKISYFYVPIMYQYRFHPRWYVEGGFQIGLRNKAIDLFDESAFDGDLTYTKSVKDDYTALDAGVLGGAGFKLKKSLKSVAIGMNYYYGLVDVSTTAIPIKNSSFYVYVKFPIGLGKPTDTTDN